MKLQVVSNRKLYIQIADQIRGQILEGAVKPGRQLPSERDLAAALGVSRPTVREALIALEVAGLVEVRVGVGAFVRERKAPQDGAAEEGDLPELNHSPLEIMRVRRLLEPEAAALACAGIHPEGAARLTETIARMRAETAAGAWSSESDQTLHMTVADACGNAVLRETLGQLWASRAGEVDTRFHRHLADMNAVRAHILGDHEAIVAAISRKEPEAARKAMGDHLAFVEAAMLGAWE